MGYGGVQLSLSLPVYTGAVAYEGAPDREILWWHVFVWQPTWIAGDLLVLIAVVTYQVQSKRTREPVA